MLFFRKFQELVMVFLECSISFVFNRLLMKPIADDLKTKMAQKNNDISVDTKWEFGVHMGQK